MSIPEEVLAELRLTGVEWSGIGKLTSAGDAMEPLAKRSGLGPKTADRLVELGLAERGPPPSAYLGRGYGIGYRLSELGWLIFDRGQFPRRPARPS